MLRKFWLVCVLVAMTACGGGGGTSGGSAPVASSLTFQFKTAWGAYQQQSKTFPFTLSGTASNPSLGTFAITGSGNVTQTSTTATQPSMDGLGGTVQAIKVTRAYQFTALVSGNSIPQTLTDIAYYDPVSYAYMGGSLTDSTSITTNHVLIQWSLPPATMTCCLAGNTTFYRTGTALNGPITHDIFYNEAIDTANSIIVNLPDTSVSGASRSYRLDNTNKLTPISENINMIAYVLTTNGQYQFNAAVKFNF